MIALPQTAAQVLALVGVALTAVSVFGPTVITHNPHDPLSLSSTPEPVTSTAGSGPAPLPADSLPQRVLALESRMHQVEGQQRGLATWQQFGVTVGQAFVAGLAFVRRPNGSRRATYPRIHSHRHNRRRYSR